MYRTCNKLQSSPGPNHKTLIKVTIVWKPVGYRKTYYYINTSEIPGELSCEDLLSSHVRTSNVKRSPLLLLHYKSRLFHWCLYNKRNITCPLVDKNFIFPYSTRYLTSERSERARYRVEHSKVKLMSTRGHVISSISLLLLLVIAFCSPFPKVYTVVVLFVILFMDEAQ